MSIACEFLKVSKVGIIAAGAVIRHKLSVNFVKNTILVVDQACIISKSMKTRSSVHEYNLRIFMVSISVCGYLGYC